jgi:hypothetical protein
MSRRSPIAQRVFPCLAAGGSRQANGKIHPSSGEHFGEDGRIGWRACRDCIFSPESIAAQTQKLRGDGKAKR